MGGKYSVPNREAPCAGFSYWGGAYGTFFWVDPKEELVAVFMAHTPGVIRQYYRSLLGAMVMQAIEK